MNAVGYVRRSSAEGKVERQREAIKHWAYQRDVTIIFVREEAVSGVSKSEDVQ